MADLSHRGQWLAVTLTIAGAILVGSAAAWVQQPQLMRSFDGFTALQAEYRNCDPDQDRCKAPVLKRFVSMNANEDWSDSAWDMSRPSSPEVRWISKGGTQLVTTPAARTAVSSWVPPQRAWAEAAVLRRLCTTRDRSRRTEQMAGFAAIRIALDEITGEKATVWLIPELACFEAKRVQRTESGDLMVKVTRSIHRGPPHADWLRVPVGYVERSSIGRP